MTSPARYLELLKYELALQEAEEELIRFCEVTMPVERAMNDIAQSRYLPSDHHRYMAHLTHRMEAGDLMKGLVRMPPRHGKTETLIKRASAWISGRNPEKDIIIGSYNSKFAEDIGAEVKEIIKSQRFRQIFPDYKLVKEAVDHLRTSQGGNIYFIGRESTVTGRGGDFLFADDLIKNDADSRSPEMREKIWQWLVQTFLTRRHNDNSPFLICGTQWNEDDHFGRLTDESNPAYSKLLSEGVEDIKLAAIAGDDDPMGRKPGEPLWPKRFGLNYLNEMQDANSTAFAALYQCDPVPENGVFYQKDGIFEYDPSELPEKLTMYACSDHAVSTKSINDRTCLIPYGVDERGDAWVMPDVFWDRVASDVAVERVIDIIRRHKPVFWYAEKGQIAKSIGPFITKRMAEENVYVPFIFEMRTQDKVQYAQSARARCAQGRIRFPRFAPWWARAKTEMLKFPNGRFDDFVDTVSIIGMRMNQHHGPGAGLVAKAPTKGTFAELKEQFRRTDMNNRAKSARAGW